VTRILLVEDELIVARDTESMLNILGYEVVDIALSGEEAIQKAHQLKPDLILMDINLKGEIDGIHATETITKLDDIPVVYCTAYAEDELIYRAKKSQPYGYIMKPFEQRVLYSSIEMALSMHEYKRALATKEEMYRELFNNISRGIIVCKKEENEYVVTDINKAAEKIEKLSKKQTVGKHLFTLLPHLKRHGLLDVFNKVTRTGKPEKLSASEQAEDEIDFWHDYYVYQLSTGETVTVIDERTHEKRIEHQFLRSERMYRAVAENAFAGIAIADPMETLTYVNPTFARILNYTPEELIGMNLKDLSPDNEFELLRKKTKSRLSGLSEYYETRLYNKSGNVRYILVSASPMYDEDKNITGTLSVILDITERKELESHLLQAQKLESIGQLAAGIAHEINTPTQYVGDNTRFLKDAFDDILNFFTKYQHFHQVARTGNIDKKCMDMMDQAIESLDIMYLNKEIPKAIEQSIEGIQRITHIVQAMKDFSHPGGAEKTGMDINKAIETTATISRNEWKYVAELITDFDENISNIPCLHDEFNQVILNLIVNATHAIEDVVGDGTKGKGSIRITTRLKGKWVEIRVSDTGTGIPEHIRDRIFDPFFTTKGIGKGTGQGLAISHNVIVQKLGGSLTFETKEGEGTTFIIRLTVDESVPTVLT
jgi:PAS domain S-box-containing protein